MQRKPNLMVTASVAVVILVTAAAGIWFKAAGRAQQQERMLESKFEQIQGYQGDPAIQAFRGAGKAGGAFLARKMKSQAPADRVKVVKALRQLGSSSTASPAGLEALQMGLEDSDAEVRSIAEGALGDLGPQAKAAVPGLTRCISGGTDINGVWALGRIGPDARAALPILETKMREKTGRERVYAAGAVWKIGGPNAEAKAVVMAALEDADAHVRVDAHNVLAESPEIDPP